MNKMAQTHKNYTMPVSKAPICKSNIQLAADTLKVSYTPKKMISDAAMRPIDAKKVEHVNERELQSIYALLAYVAYNQNVEQDRVQMVVEAEFGVDHVTKISSDDYMNAIEFLVDLKMDEKMN